MERYFKGLIYFGKGLIVEFGNGRSTFLWYHHWISNDPIYKLMTRDVPDSIAHWYVSDMIFNWK